MIAKATRGSDMGRLVRYLLGEQAGAEAANAHVAPRVIAAEETVIVAVGRTLTRAEETDLTAQLKISSDLYGTQIGGGHVYHVSLATKAGTDRDLTDPEWAQIAAETVRQLGFVGPEAAAPCAWVAVRHGHSAQGNDHMHLAVNLVREGGQAASIHRDRVKLSGLCADMERRFGLLVVEGRANKTGMSGLTRAEIHKTKRVGRYEPERTEVARTVRAVALASRSEDEFVRRARRAGLVLAPFHDQRSGQVTGYSAGCRPAGGNGQPVYFAGGRLGRDLTLPALRRGWGHPAGGRKGAAEWGSNRGSGPGRYLHGGWPEASRRYGPARRPATSGGPETQRWAVNQWQEAGIRLGQVVRELAAVPANDQEAWQRAAHQAAGLMAGLAGRIEPAPGPLARAAEVMARSAQPAGSRRPAAAQGEGHTLRNVSAVMAQAQITDQAALGWRLMLTELLRLAQSIAQAHLARGEAQQAARLAADARAALEEARARIGTPAQVAQLIPALAAQIEEQQDRDNDGGRKKRKRPGGLQAEDYAALAARQQRPEQPKPRRPER